VLLARARVLRAEGDAPGARARLEAAFQDAPWNDEIRLELAELLLADGRELDRVAALLDGLREPERSRRGILLSAELSELRGDDAAAADGYARALAITSDPDLRLRRALALERLGRGDEALRELEQAKQERPDDPAIRARLGDRYEAAGLLADAEAELVAAAQAAPDRPVGWDRLAGFYGRIGRPEKARAAAARARELVGVKDRALRPLLRSSR
jgi:predicted Zn-dependent protease